MTKMYTANQPLLLGGQIYMWNRYFQAKNLVHMMEAQFTKFGHQSRIELLNGQGQKQMFIVPLEDRNFRPLNDVYLQHPDKVGELFVKTLDALYPVSKVKDANFRWGVGGDLLEELPLQPGPLERGCHGLHLGLPVL